MIRRPWMRPASCIALFRTYPASASGVYTPGARVLGRAAVEPDRRRQGSGRSRVILPAATDLDTFPRISSDDCRHRA